MIKVFDISENLDIETELKSILIQLPEWRLQKTLSYRNNIDRFLCAKSYLMLEEMLRDNFSLKECPEFAYGNNGKPYLRDYPTIYFNISHCHKGIACAVADGPVGIDIEEIQYDEDLASIIFNAEEMSMLRNSAEPDVKFTELWTLKESFLKLTGEGIKDDLKSVLSEASGISFKTEVNRSAGYVYSVVTTFLQGN